ncbi:MAG: pyridoxamine 5'-phosphate oxidase [Gammaproteobacteria bacterium]|nr:pyridoxamine 5'-phosphate oxidase [Gammaproteobacteria bacterium]
MLKTDSLRKKFMAEGLQQSELAADPYQQFENWYQQTMNSDLPEPTAMSLATVDTNGQPWQRMVLLKIFDQDGFIFFTNYSSRKAEHIENNARVSLLFPWHAMGRQVKVTGQAEKISTAESLKYFSSRPRGSQIGAWASRQSKVIKSRSLLDTMFEQVKKKFTDGEIPLPDFWGGYRIKADSLEFWQARDNRLHDCFFYQKDDNGQWNIDRLEP